MMIILIRVIREVGIYFMIMIVFREVEICFFEDLDAVHDASVGKLSESGGPEENLVRIASHL